MAENFDEIDRNLRDIDREFRREAAADEELAELQRRRREGLGEFLTRAMHRGDRVTVEVGGVAINSPILAVGRDYATLSDGAVEIDVRLTAVSFRILPARVGGSSGRPASQTFRARVAEHEQMGLPIEAALRDGARIIGVPKLLAADHLRLADQEGVDTVVPLDLVVAVFSSLR